jgi:hypothetical protein
MSLSNVAQSIQPLLSHASLPKRPDGIVKILSPISQLPEPVQRFFFKAKTVGGAYQGLNKLGDLSLNDLGGIENFFHAHIPSLGIKLFPKMDRIPHKDYARCLFEGSKNGKLVLPISEEGFKHDLDHALDWSLYPEEIRSYVINRLNDHRVWVEFFESKLNELIIGPASYTRAEHGRTKAFYNQFINPYNLLAGDLLAGDKFLRVGEFKNVETHYGQRDRNPQQYLLTLFSKSNFLPRRMEMRLVSKFDGVGNYSLYRLEDDDLRGYFLTGVNEFGRLSGDPLSKNKPVLSLSSEAIEHAKNVGNFFRRIY